MAGGRLFNAGSPQVGEMVEVSSLDPAQREWIAAELRAGSLSGYAG